jgi:hypothetical protein
VKSRQWRRKRTTWAVRTGRCHGPRMADALNSAQLTSPSSTLTKRLRSLCSFFVHVRVQVFAMSAPDAAATDAAPTEQALAAVAAAPVAEGDVYAVPAMAPIDPVRRERAMRPVRRSGDRAACPVCCVLCVLYRPQLRLPPPLRRVSKAVHLRVCRRPRHLPQRPRPTATERSALLRPFRRRTTRRSLPLRCRL